MMNSFLSSISEKPLQVIDASISLNKYMPISISSDNKGLIFDISSSDEWENYINKYLQNNNAIVAYGGYLEKRDIYNRSSHFNKTEAENQRNIHLGVDLWCNVNTNVLSVLDGEIHSFNNNKNFGDYGPTIVLKHEIDNKNFYSLYGHLTENSIKNLKVGEKVYQGQTIAQLGDSSVNGDYAPHLHFQLIIDIQENFGDYPGVCSQKELDFYKQNCPNPMLLLKIEE